MRRAGGGAVRASQVQITGATTRMPTASPEAGHPDRHRAVGPDGRALEPQQRETDEDAGGGTGERAADEEREHVAQMRERPVEAGDAREQPPAEQALERGQRRREEHRAGRLPER